jgi:hypothetical protein
MNLSHIGSGPGNGEMESVPVTNVGLQPIPEAIETKLNSVAFIPQANYTDRVTATCWRS